MGAEAPSFLVGKCWRLIDDDCLLLFSSFKLGLCYIYTPFKKCFRYTHCLIRHLRLFRSIFNA